jgi:methyl-accepting chemotaxis protein
VRSLAQRSADAAREIKALIEDSATTVDSGSQLVEKAGKTMNDVVQGVKRVSDIIGGITRASEAQAAGIEQVNHAISQMDQVTQQNAALVEEAAAAADSLKGQAARLVQGVEVFRLAA